MRGFDRMVRAGKTRHVPGPEIRPRKRRQPKTGPTVRLPPELKAALQEVANEQATSLNSLCVDFLAYALDEYRKARPPKR